MNQGQNSVLFGGYKTHVVLFLENTCILRILIWPNKTLSPFIVCLLTFHIDHQLSLEIYEYSQPISLVFI